ncbi:MAG: hypothetical protein LBU19_10565 [Treponema sp.]|jgi:hypothetical protein|nr:hypothetical protein [Treponema sp.]
MMPLLRNIVFDCDRRPLQILSRRDMGGYLRLEVKPMDTAVELLYSRVKEERELEKALEREGRILIGWRSIHRKKAPMDGDIRADYLQKKGDLWVYRHTLRLYWVWVDEDDPLRRRQETAYQSQSGITRISRKKALEDMGDAPGTHYLSAYKLCAPLWLLTHPEDLRPLYLAGESLEVKRYEG